MITVCLKTTVRIEEAVVNREKALEEFEELYLDWPTTLTKEVYLSLSLSLQRRRSS